MSLPSSTHSPYPLARTAIGEEFTTDLGEQYVIYFSDASEYFKGLDVARHAFMLGFMRLTENEDNEDDTPPHDPRISATILQVLERFFEDNRKVMAYVCQSGKREKYRHRLFTLWFSRYNNSRFVRHVSSETEGLFAAIIYSKNSPYAWELQQKLPSMEDKLTFY